MNEMIEMAKIKLKILKNQGSDTCGVFKSVFFFFSINQTPICLEFVEWNGNKYSKAEGVIMNKTKSRILCPIQISVICKALSIPQYFVQLSQE